MNIRLVDYTSDSERSVARHAGVCYGSPTDDNSLDRRIKHLMKVKHLATLRFAYATFEVDGVSRNCTHQLVRHPHISYLQESQRYVKTRIEWVTPPDIASRPDLNVIFQDSCSDVFQLYQHLTESGIKKEDARYVLPSAAISKIMMTGNLQSWYDFLVNRTDSHAQWEIREVAVEVGKQLYAVAPNVFKEFKGEE